MKGPADLLNGHVVAVRRWANFKRGPSLASHSDKVRTPNPWHRWIQPPPLVTPEPCRDVQVGPGPVCIDEILQNRAADASRCPWPVFLRSATGLLLSPSL